jgi:glycerol-3-phosphate dehydrogenase
MRLLFLDALAAVEVAPLVAKLMANELGMDQDWIEEQVAVFNELAGIYLMKGS